MVLKAVSIVCILIGLSLSYTQGGKYFHGYDNGDWGDYGGTWKDHKHDWGDWDYHGKGWEDDSSDWEKEEPYPHHKPYDYYHYNDYHKHDHNNYNEHFPFPPTSPPTPSSPKKPLNLQPFRRDPTKINTPTSPPVPSFTKKPLNLQPFRRDPTTETNTLAPPISSDFIFPDQFAAVVSLLKTSTPTPEASSLEESAKQTSFVTSPPLISLRQ